jgi:FKBP-type peptidyl-prolyl cis-trans isomerase FkpA
MIKNVFLLALVSLVLTACNKNKVSVTDNGLKYQFHIQNEGKRKAKLGEIVTLHMVMKATSPKDSVLNDTYKGGNPVKIMVQPSSFKGDFKEGFTMLSVGDSVTFYVSADSLFNQFQQPFPSFVSKGSDIAFTFKVLNIQNKDEFEKAMQKHKQDQVGVDAKRITEYLAKNNITNSQKTASGLHYVIKQEGSGTTPAKGDSVTVHYLGRLTDGKEFDSSYKNGQPFTFPVGMGFVIPGWDEGLQKLKKGSKATFIIPSYLAYGSESPGPGIPADAILVFDVELLNITKGRK